MLKCRWEVAQVVIACLWVTHTITINQTVLTTLQNLVFKEQNKRDFDDW